MPSCGGDWDLRIRPAARPQPATGGRFIRDWADGRHRSCYACPTWTNRPAADARDLPCARGTRASAPQPREGMEPDGPPPLRARVRWGNIARAAALLALAVLVLAWPHLRADPPALPPARAVPVTPAPPTAPAPPTTPAPPAPPTAPPAVTPPAPHPRPRPTSPERSRRSGPAARAPRPRSGPRPAVPTQPRPLAGPQPPPSRQPPPSPSPPRADPSAPAPEFAFEFG